MTYRVTIQIRCDQSRCGQEIRFERENRGGLSATAAANSAAERGWQVARGRTSTANAKVARCPDHRTVPA